MFKRWSWTIEGSFFSSCNELSEVRIFEASKTQIIFTMRLIFVSIEQDRTAIFRPFCTLLAFISNQLFEFRIIKSLICRYEIRKKYSWRYRFTPFKLVQVLLNYPSYYPVVPLIVLFHALGPSQWYLDCICMK